MKLVSVILPPTLEGSCQNTNEFKPFTLTGMICRKNDEKWKEMTIANTSLQFDQEFGNTFFGTGDTLIDGETLMGSVQKILAKCVRWRLPYIVVDKRPPVHDCRCL